MQRPIEEIVGWNLKKIDSDISEFRLKLNEIGIKARECQLDVSKASPILNNIMITVDSLEMDAQRLLQKCQMGDAVKLQEHKPKTSSGEQKTQNRTTSPFTHQLDPNQTVHVDQMPLNIGQRLKKVEEIICSHNIEQRLETVENLQSSNVQRLEVIEKLKLPINFPERLTKVETIVFPQINNRLDIVETQLKEMLKGVCGGNVPMTEIKQSVSHQMSSLKKSFQESCMRLERVEGKVNAHAAQERRASNNFIHVLILVFLMIIFYIIHNIKE